MHVHRGGDGDRPSVKAELLGRFALAPAFRSSALTTLHCAQSRPASQSAARYVIKRLQRRHVDDSELRQLLLDVGRAGLGRSTPHLLQTLEVHDDPEPFLVMEHVEGIDLERLLPLGGDQDAARWLVPVIVDVLLGLSALHESSARSLVHGAPCARHVLVGVDGMARLLDLTHAVGPEIPWSQSRSAIFAGRELAPEQVLAPAHLDPRCDLFIVGRLLWQALTGRAPFRDEGADNELESMLRGSALLPSEAGSRAGRGLDAVCIRALHKVRGARYATALEMARDLRREAQRAGLWATRQELGQWVESARRRLRAPTPGDAAYKGETIHGIGPVVDISREAPKTAKPGSQSGAVSSGAGRRAAAQAFPYVVVAESAVPALDEWPRGEAAQQEERGWREAQPSVPPPGRGARSFVRLGSLCALAAALSLALSMREGAPGAPKAAAPESVERPASDVPQVEAAAARAPVPRHTLDAEGTSAVRAAEVPASGRREAGPSSAPQTERSAPRRALDTARRAPRSQGAERARAFTPARPAGAASHERVPQTVTSQPEAPDVPDNPYE